MGSKYPNVHNLNIETIQQGAQFKKETTTTVTKWTPSFCSNLDSSFCSIGGGAATTIGTSHSLEKSKFV